MTTFEDILKKRPINPEILEEKVRKMLVIIKRRRRLFTLTWPKSTTKKNVRLELAAAGVSLPSLWKSNHPKPALTCLPAHLPPPSGAALPCFSTE